MAKKRVDPESEAALEIVNREKIEKELKESQRQLKEKSIAWVYEASGKIKALNFTESQSNFFRLVMLKQVKDAKSYRDTFGMTWEDFCEHVGVNRRWVDEQLQDLKPFKSDFLEAFLHFSGVSFSKIRYLGDAISEETAEIRDNAIIFQGQTIPIDAEHTEEIQALLEKLDEDHKAILSDKDAELKAHKRIATSKEDVIKKMEKEIKLLQHSVDVTDLTPEEQEQVDLMRELQDNVVNLVNTVKLKIPYNDNSSPVVLRQLYFLYIFCSKVFMDERLILNEIYKDAEDVPWEITEAELPPTEVLIDNAPLTKGMGPSYREKIAKRKK